jgi:hypothetical protein
MGRRKSVSESRDREERRRKIQRISILSDKEHWKIISKILEPEWMVAK